METLELNPYLEDINSSVLSDGHSELLLGTTLEWNETLEATEEANGVQWLNGSRVVQIETLKTKLEFDPETKRIRQINFTMPSDDCKLSQVFEGIPYGIIKKNRTGVGATTMELKSKRNSIIVVPTRALAINKALNSKLPNSNFYAIQYVGGYVPNTKFPSITEYLNNEYIAFKKFIVVIDSLPQLLNELGTEAYRDYFIMYDEVDSLQDSSFYRQRIETAFDYYHKFPIYRRSIVSATMFPFSNPILKNEPIINVEFTTPLCRDITLYPTIRPIEKTRDLILEILSTHPNDKILVALNLITDGILTIIESFPNEIKDKCGVLCSDSTKSKVVPYDTELRNNSLLKQITFMTSNHFVGVDIMDRFHLVCSQTTKHPFTLLSTEKLIQISGRCRISGGVLSESIVYDWKPSDPVIWSELESSLVEKANRLSNLSVQLDLIREDFPVLFDGPTRLTKEDILRASQKKYLLSDSICLLRIDDKDKLVPSYFNIDNILIQNYLRSSLYSSPLTLKNKLEEEGNNIIYNTPQEDTYTTAQEAREIVSERLIQTLNNERNNVIEELRSTDSTQRKDVAQRLRINCSESIKRFITRFMYLYDYLEFEELISKLTTHDKPKEYEAFKNAVLIWALDEQHSIKSTIRDNFRVGEIMSGEEISEAFNAIYSGLLGYRPISQRQCFHRLAPIVKLSSRTSTTRNGVKIYGYRIESLNPYNLEGNPKSQIHRDVDMRRMLKL